MRYNVYYMKPEYFPTFIHGTVTPDLYAIDRTHVLLREVEASDLETLFHNCQGEVWSPNGEARDMITSKGLAHTSMSVGDVAMDDEGVFWAVAIIGFTRLGRR